MMKLFKRKKNKKNNKETKKENNNPLKNLYHNAVEEHINNSINEKLFKGLNDYNIDNPSLEIQQPISEELYSKICERSGMNIPPEPNINSVQGDNNVVGGKTPLTSVISPEILSWYANQSYVDYRALALMSQNWLIDRACKIKGEDAVNANYRITFLNVSEDKKEKYLDYLELQREKFNLDEELIRASKFNNVFGIRPVLFKFDLGSKKKNNLFYSNPFRKDQIKKGMEFELIQIDPNYTYPIIGSSNTLTGPSLDFMNPRSWYLNGQVFHDSHMVLLKGSEVSDILKAAYRYGGISLTQKIYERARLAEIGANEITGLLKTKRSYVVKKPLEETMLNSNQVIAEAQKRNLLQSNYSQMVIGLEDEFIQLETNLTGIGDAIMVPYQLVAAASGIPLPILLRTSPKGFQSTGSLERTGYFDEVKKDQILLAKIIKKFNYLSLLCEFGEEVYTSIEWLSTPVTDKLDESEVLKNTSEGISKLTESGVISPDEGYKELSNNRETFLNDI